MHPVIKHILARKNCVRPPQDGRKIALVLFGGVMSGVQGAGALVALTDLGLQHAFDDIYASSAGVPNAAYFLTDEVRKGETIYYEDLSGRRFINLFTPWQFENVPYLMDIFRRVKKLNVVGFANSSTRVHVWLRNLKTNKEEFVPFEGNDEEHLYELLRASISMPYLSPGLINLNGIPYKDGLKYRHGFLDTALAESGITDYLVLYNRRNQQIVSRASEKVLEIFPNQSLRSLVTDREKVFAAARRMENQIKGLFSRPDQNEKFELPIASRYY